MIARVRVFMAKLGGLLGGGRPEHEFDEELAVHLGLLARKYEREGLSPEDAQLAARRQFGNVTLLRESRREMLSFAPLLTFLRDVRYGARVLARSPGWTAVAVLTLALGIGANVAIFSVVRPILLDPLPYPQADRLVLPRTVFMRENVDRGAVSFADVIDWRNAQVFEHVGVYNPASADLTGGNEPERVGAARVDDEYFRVMGSPPAAGRFFTAEENLPQGPAVVVLGHALWTRRFGGDSSVVGARIEVGGTLRTVVGVARPDSTWPSEAEMFLPIGTGGPPNANMLRRDNHVYQVVARLLPGVSLDRVQAQLTVMGSAIARQSSNRAETNWKVHSLSSYIVGPVLHQTVVTLVAAVVFVLLIACVNVANLLLARGAGREREVVIRSALGAGWKRIAAQFFAETALLSAAGGVAGVFAGYWGLKALVHVAPRDIPRLENARVDAGVLLFAVALTVATTLLAGVAPAWHAARLAPRGYSQAPWRSASQGLRAGRLRSLLVVVELALAIVLLTGAGLLVRSFAHLQQVDPGVTIANVLTMQTSPPGGRYQGAPQLVDAFARITEAVRRVPGVVGASAATSLPLGGGGYYLGRDHLREGQPEPPASRETPGQWCGVQPGYFLTMGIPILDGRDFTSRDTATSTPVVIVSRAMAREMFPEGRAIGRRIRSWRDENVYREIVGIVGDVRLFGLTEPLFNSVYVPHSQAPAPSMVLVARTGGDPNAAIKVIREAIWSIDRKLPVAEVRTLERIADGNLARPRFSMLLLGIFGLVAVVLAALGIYGVIAYTVAQRTREMGIRMALGAARGRVVALVAWNAVRLGAVGVASGLAGAYVLTRLIRTLLFDVSPTDPWTFAAAALALMLVALAAAVVPARRAARVDPATALRCE